MTSRDDDLTARIRNRQKARCRSMARTLRASANNELRITEAYIKAGARADSRHAPRTKAEVEQQIAQIHAALEKGLARTQSLLLRAWLRPLMVGLVISLASSARAGG